MDLAPTFLELAGITYPEVYNNNKNSTNAGGVFAFFLSWEN